MREIEYIGEVERLREVLKSENAKGVI